MQSEKRRIRATRLTGGLLFAAVIILGVLSRQVGWARATLRASSALMGNAFSAPLIQPGATKTARSSPTAMPTRQETRGSVIRTPSNAVIRSTGVSPAGTPSPADAAPGTPKSRTPQMGTSTVGATARVSSTVGSRVNATQTIAGTAKGRTPTPGQP